MATVINCQESKFLNLFQLELLSKIVEKMKAGSFNFIYPFILRFKTILSEIQLLFTPNRELTKILRINTMIRFKRAKTL